jgi:hypothetical protein
MPTSSQRPAKGPMSLRRARTSCHVPLLTLTQPRRTIASWWMPAAHRLLAWERLSCYN